GSRSTGTHRLVHLGQFGVPVDLFRGHGSINLRPCVPRERAQLFRRPRNPGENMKSLTFALPLAALLAASINSADAQRISRDNGPTRIGLFAGGSTSTMTGGGVLPQQSRTGFQGGLSLILPFTETFSLRTGVSYVQKGVTDSLASS